MAPNYVLVSDLEYHTINASVLRVLRWLPSASARGVRVLSVFDGGIRNEFAALAPVTAVNEYRPRRPSSALRELGLARPAEVARSAGLRRRLSRGAVYLADLGACRLLHWVGEPVVVVAHVRPGDDERLAALSQDDRAGLARVDHWLVDREAGDESLVADLARDGAMVRSFHQDVPLELLWPEVRARSRAERRVLLAERHAIPADRPLVVGGGHVDFWHQTDVFLQCCWSLHLAAPATDLHFAWIAGDSSERMLWPLRHDIDHAGLGDRVHVVDGDAPPLLEAAAAADVFVRTNRLAPDPWLTTAMATAGIPAVGFAHDGNGPPDTVAVPWMDVEGFRDAVAALVADPERRAALGQLAPEAPTVWDVRVAAEEIARSLSGERRL